MRCLKMFSLTTNIEWKELRKILKCVLDVKWWLTSCIKARFWVGQVEEAEDIVWGSCGQVSKVSVEQET